MGRFVLTVASIGLLVAAPARAQSQATTAPAPPAMVVPQPPPTPRAQTARPATPTTPPAPATTGRAGQGQTPPPQAPQAPQAAQAPRRLPTQNVRIDVTITDSMGSGTAKKTVTMLVADARSGQVRSSMQIPQPMGPPISSTGGTVVPAPYSYTNISLNVDATPEVLPDGRIFITMNVQYTPDAAQEPGGSRRPGSLNEALSVVLTDGKQTLISQSADPQGDRKVVLELTASVVK